MSFWQRNRHTDQWYKIENTEINPHKHVQLIFNKGVKMVQWKKYTIFNKWCQSNWTPTAKK